MPAPRPAVEARPVTEAQWERLRAPFDADHFASRIVVGANHGTKAIVRFAVWPTSVEDRLDAVLRPEQYSVRYRPVAPAERPTMLCRLRVGGAEREGTGAGDRWRSAQRWALSSAASSLGIGRAGTRTMRAVASVEHRVDVPEETRQKLERPFAPSMHAPGED